MPTNRNNREFQKWKVKPPTSDEHGTEEEIAERIKSQFGAKHVWKQKGNYIFCNAHDGFEHGNRVATDDLLEGTDDKGQPQLTKLKLKG